MYSWEVGEGMDVINQYKYAARYNNWPPPHTHTLLLICCLISHPKFVPLDLQHVFASPGLFDLFLYDKGKEGDIYIYILYISFFFLSLSLFALSAYLSIKSIILTYRQRWTGTPFHSPFTLIVILAFFLPYFLLFFLFHTSLQHTSHREGFPHMFLDRVPSSVLSSGLVFDPSGRVSIRLPVRAYGFRETRKHTHNFISSLTMAKENQSLNSFLIWLASCFWSTFRRVGKKLPLA